MTRRHGRPSRLARWLVWLLFLAAIVPTAAIVACMSDSKMIDRHEKKLDEEDE